MHGFVDFPASPIVAAAEEVRSASSSAIVKAQIDLSAFNCSMVALHICTQCNMCMYFPQLFATFPL
jgi:hypothetical protein